jgi:hypothetical protein
MWAPSLGVVLLSGCAAVVDGPLQSAWYFHTAPPDSEGKTRPTEIQIGLLNRSSQVIHVDQVLLNTNAEDDKRTWKLDWGQTPRPLDLEPGKLTILSTNKFSRQTDDKGMKFSELCLVPVSVHITVSASSRPSLEKSHGRAIFDDNGNVSVLLSGRMPTSLPYAWDSCTLKKE